MPQWVVKPANSILISGEPIYKEATIGANATAVKMLPGRFVIHDTEDGDVKEGGAKANNVLGQLDIAGDKKINDNYAVGEQARLLTGVYEAKVLLLANENVEPGDRLVLAADGKVAKLAVGAAGSTGAVIAVAEESSNVAQDAWIAALVNTLGSHSIAAA